MRFGVATTFELENPDQSPEEYEDWAMFLEIFTTDTGAKIYSALNKHQSVGYGSRAALLKKTNKQHQMALKLIDSNKTYRPQF